MNPFKPAAHWLVKARVLLMHVSHFAGFFFFLFLKREGKSENHYLKNIKIRPLSPSRNECWTYGMLFPWVKAVVTAIAAVCVRERIFKCI